MIRYRREFRARTGAFAFVASLLLAASFDALAHVTPKDEDAAFVAENTSAMDRMMNGMMKPPSGDVDQDFVAMMTPHHQGAIDMAQAELRYGKNEQLRRIAQEIIVEQQQEIIAMRLALGQPLPAPAPAPDQAQQKPTPHDTAHPHAMPAGMNHNHQEQQ